MIHFLAINSLINHNVNAISNPRLGIACAIGAQVIWGGFPLYIQVFKGIIEPSDFVAHRAIWSFVILIGWMICVGLLDPRKQFQSSARRLVGDRKVLQTASLATLMLAINWLTFVWAVNNGHALDASLGYYICPQIIVLLGVFFLRERLTALQQVAFILATVGVAIMTFSAASMPLIGVALAVAFGIYALIKKQTSLSSIEGLALETGIMLLPAIAFLVWRTQVDGVAVFADSLGTNVLLLLSGCLTVAPLLLLATAVKHIPLSTAGLLQFIGPTIQFFLGVFVIGESFDRSRSIGFVFVWLGVGLFLFGAQRGKRSREQREQKK